MLGRIMTLLLSFFGNQVPFKEIYMGAKLTRGGLMMVDFICQLKPGKRVPIYLVKHHPRYMCVRAG